MSFFRIFLFISMFLFLRLPLSLFSDTLSLCSSFFDSTSSNSAFPFGGNNNSNSRIAHTFRWYLPACSLTVRMLLQRGVRSGPPLHRELHTQSSWGIGLVPLWRILGMSRTDWNPLEVTQRRFAPLLVVCHSTFSLSFVHVAPCSPWKCACQYHLESAVIRFFLRFSVMARTVLARCHELPQPTNMSLSTWPVSVSSNTTEGHNKRGRK